MSWYFSIHSLLLISVFHIYMWIWSRSIPRWFTGLGGRAKVFRVGCLWWGFFFGCLLRSIKKGRKKNGRLDSVWGAWTPLHGRHSRLRRPLHKADVFRTDFSCCGWLDLTWTVGWNPAVLSLAVHHDLREIHRSWTGSPHHPYEHQELLSERHWRRSLFQLGPDTPGLQKIPPFFRTNKLELVKRYFRDAVGGFFKKSVQFFDLIDVGGRFSWRVLCQARSRGGKNLAPGGSKEKVKLGRHF